LKKCKVLGKLFWGIPTITYKMGVPAKFLREEAAGGGEKRDTWGALELKKQNQDERSRSRLKKRSCRGGKRFGVQSGNPVERIG